VVDAPAIKALQKYEWPGNVRELKNVVERAVSLTEGNVIGVDQLPREILDCGTNNVVVSGQSDTPLADELAKFEKHLIRSRLEALQGNMSKTAKSLGVSRSTLYEKCQKHQLI
jgi:DNA-binding NtrC family response regulator